LKTGLSILFFDEEIDKERGVVLEEYRLGLGASKRMMGRYISKMMHDSKYATRLPIGQKRGFRNFNQSLINFTKIGTVLT
jgi:zinc protease